MNLTFLTKTDKDLHAMRFQQDTDGKLARQEIQRRKLVGYCDGTAIQKIDAKAPIIEPEILQDGDHDIEVCAKVSERVFSAVMQ